MSAPTHASVARSIDSARWPSQAQTLLACHVLDAFEVGPVQVRKRRQIIVACGLKCKDVLWQPQLPQPLPYSLWICGSEAEACLAHQPGSCQEWRGHELHNQSPVTHHGVLMDRSPSCGVSDC